MSGEGHEETMDVEIGLDGSLIQKLEAERKVLACLTATVTYGPVITLG